MPAVGHLTGLTVKNSNRLFAVAVAACSVCDSALALYAPDTSVGCRQRHASYGAAAGPAEIALLVGRLCSPGTAGKAVQHEAYEGQYGRLARFILPFDNVKTVIKFKGIVVKRAEFNNFQFYQLHCSTSTDGASGSIVRPSIAASPARRASAATMRCELSPSRKSGSSSR